jgi:hypothetical protein
MSVLLRRGVVTNRCGRRSFGRSGKRSPEKGGGRGLHCDTMSHVVSELIEEVWLMPGV